MKCELTDRMQRMEEYVMGKMSEKEIEDFEIHVFGCPECLEHLRIREQVVKLIKEERESVIADYTTKKESREFTIKDSFGRQRGWIYAGAVAVLLLAIFLFRPMWRGEAIDPANFGPNPFFEDVMRQKYQSTGYSVTVSSPRVGQNLSGDINFQWQSFSDGEPHSRALELKILDNRETVIFSELIQDTQFTFEKKLQPGLYYWTLEDHGEMLYLGKFYIDKPGSLVGD
ncbi:MAG TPA: zf-HC2 domain-containing protein [bacterium]